jgi:hypothetical protein
MTDLNPLIARLAAIGVKVAATEAPTTLDSLKAAQKAKRELEEALRMTTDHLKVIGWLADWLIG